MKKGFTLIELLAVIVILAVILVIAISQVLKVVDNSRISAYLKNEQMVLKAIDLYVSRNTGSLPGEIGSTTEVSINYLVSNGMLTEITNPYNKNEDCTGYVTIMKLSDTEYDYTPHLRCGLDIHSSSDDGLVLHYKFDDFQEPTENLVDINNVSVIGGNNYGNIEIEDNTVIYNSNSNGYGIRLGDFVLSPNTEYSLSLNYEGELGSNWGWRVYNKQTETWFVSPTRTKKATFTTQNATEYIISFYIGFPTGIEQKCYFFNIQVEKKSYATPFVNGIREGVVKDYSGNGNHAELQLNTTPRWIFDEERNSGVYLFDGSPNRIETTESSMFNILDKSMTISIWIKLNELPGAFGDRKSLLGKRQGGQWGNSNREGYLFFLHNNTLSILLQDITDNHIYQQFNYNWELNNWYKIDVVINRETSELFGYVNGEKLGIPIDISSIGNIVNDLPLTISYNYQGANPKQYIDDVRIYNRALSETEIKQLYNSQK